MSEITIDINDALAQKLEDFAKANGASIAEMTTQVWQTWVQNETANGIDVSETTEAIKQELDRRWQAYKNGDIQGIPVDESKKIVRAHLDRIRAKQSDKQQNEPV